MRKFLAVILALCMAMTVLPVFAEPAEEESGSGKLEEILAGILGGEGSLQEKAAALIEQLSGLKEKFAGKDKEFSAFLSSLSQKLKDLIKPGEEALGSLLSGIKEMFAGGSDMDLGGILSGLFSGGESDLGDKLGSLFGGSGFDLSGILGDSGEGSEESSEEDDEELYAMLDEMNRQAEAATGEGVPNWKPAESVEEFYGDWMETKYIYDGQEYDMSEYNEGVYIAENTYYTTVDGKKSEDYLYPETAELSITDGVLKVNSDGYWTALALTEDGELVLIGSSMLFYFARVEK